MVERLITEEAAKVLRVLQEAHGDLLFHQSGGCCDLRTWRDGQLAHREEET